MIKLRNILIPPSILVFIIFFFRKFHNKSTCGAITLSCKLSLINKESESCDVIRHNGYSFDDGAEERGPLGTSLLSGIQKIRHSAPEFYYCLPFSVEHSRSYNDRACCLPKTESQIKLTPSTRVTRLSPAILSVI